MKYTLLTLVLALVPSIGHSQAHCGNTYDIVGFLEEEHGEYLVAYGLDTTGVAVQVYVNNEKDTYSILTSSPSGVSCVVSTGTAFNLFGSLDKGTDL